MIRDESLRTILGSVRRDALSVYSVVRNEMFFLPAFLDHYRGLGCATVLIRRRPLD